MDKITILLAALMLFFGPALYAGETTDCPEGTEYDEEKQECVATPQEIAYNDDNGMDEDDTMDEDDDMDEDD